MDDVTAALIAAWSALPALAGVSIYDGPGISQAPDLDLVMVGDDGDPESDVLSTFEQEWANLSHTRRSERGEIPCAAIAQSGETDMNGRRVRVFQLLAACESALVADPTLGDVALSLEFIGGSARPVQNSRGAAMVAPFTVRYWTQL
jgi:hypothetical protein